MQLLGNFKNLQVTGVIGILIIVSACSDFAANVRKVTYPPDFNYVSRDQLRSNMQTLAFEMQMLDEALTAKDINQHAVEEILRTMEKIGSSLQAGNAGSNHPRLDNYMRDFVSNVAQARLAASQNPPRYYQAGRISGACTNCHVINR